MHLQECNGSAFSEVLPAELHLFRRGSRGVESTYKAGEENRCWWWSSYCGRWTDSLMTRVPTSSSTSSQARWTPFASDRNGPRPGPILTPHLPFLTSRPDFSPVFGSCGVGGRERSRSSKSVTIWAVLALACGARQWLVRDWVKD